MGIATSTGGERILSLERISRCRLLVLKEVTLSTCFHKDEKYKEN
jgi:hypothetical protein